MDLKAHYLQATAARSAARILGVSRNGFDSPDELVQAIIRLHPAQGAGLNARIHAVLNAERQEVDFVAQFANGIPRTVSEETELAELRWVSQQSVKLLEEFMSKLGS